MNDFTKFNATLGVSDVYVKTIAELHKRFHLHTTIKILIVVDGGISLTEAPSAFGVARVIRLLRESHIGCTHFSVDTARRNSSTAGSPSYTNFRFDQQEAGQPILNKYHEVWCFGFNPDNNAGPDSNITQASALPMGDTELTALTTWMNDRRGGLLAMGDHDYLGASMCHRIPRIRSMRRWTNAQGVPPIGGAGNADTHLRHDTNQPATLGQISSGVLIPFSNQEDVVPQKNRLGALDFTAGFHFSYSPAPTSYFVPPPTRPNRRDARPSARRMVFRGQRNQSGRAAQRSYAQWRRVPDRRRQSTKTNGNRAWHDHSESAVQP